MATIVPNNPYNTQPPNTADNRNIAAAPTTGIVGSAMAPTGNLSQVAPRATSNLPSNVGATPSVAPNIATYDVTQRTVDRPTETAQGQIESILSKDSPLMERARTLARQGMAQRGLVNSSMSQGAGVASMIDRATPIATQDAQTFSQAASENMNAMNTSGQFNAGELNKFSLQDAAQTFQATQNEKDRAQQIMLADKNITANQALEMARQEFQRGESSLDRTQQTNITDKQIVANKDLESARQAFTAAQNEFDRAQQTAINDKSIAANKDLETSRQSFNAALSELERAQQTNIADKQITANKDLESARQSFNAALSELERAQQTNIADKQITANKDLESARQNFNAALSELERDQQIAVVKLNNELNNANLSKTFASNLALSSSNQVAAIAADPNLTPEAKRVAIQNAIDGANATMQWGSTFYGTTLPTIAGPKGNASTVEAGGTYKPPNSSASNKPAWQEYLDLNPDIAKVYGYSQEGAVQHFREYGNRENRGGVTDAFKAML